MEILPASFFIKNRSKLKDLLLPGSVVIVSSNRMMPRNGDQYFPFRQSSDLYYLTGIKQDMCTLVLYPAVGPGTFNEILFIPEGDKKREMWEGPKIDQEAAIDISGVKDVRYTTELKKDIRKILSDCPYVYFGMPIENPIAPFPSNEIEIREELSSVFGHIEEHKLSPLMARIRSIKEPEEIDIMKRAIAVTGDAFIRVLRNIRPGMKEFEVAALLSYEFQTQGVKDHAFDPILASGRNALVLHYVDNLDICNDGDLLLMDFGADWEYYAADISRTIPVSGRFNKRQRELYDSNLRVMREAVKLMKPGIRMNDFNEEVGKLWEEEHVKLGLYSNNDLKKQVDRWPLWRRYFWHGISHSIGIDVHDAFDQSEIFKKGMVLSCEPGIYIPEEGTGIRLENDILITDGEAINLSENIPIDPDAIEVIMNKG